MRFVINDLENDEIVVSPSTVGLTTLGGAASVTFREYTEGQLSRAAGMLLTDRMVDDLCSALKQSLAESVRSG